MNDYSITEIGRRKNTNKLLTLKENMKRLIPRESKNVRFSNNIKIIEFDKTHYSKSLWWTKEDLIRNMENSTTPKYEIYLALYLFITIGLSVGFVIWT